jgi:hypothetical protein
MRSSSARAALAAAAVAGLAFLSPSTGLAAVIPDLGQASNYAAAGDSFSSVNISNDARVQGNVAAGMGSQVTVAGVAWVSGYLALGTYPQSLTITPNAQVDGGTWYRPVEDELDDAWSASAAASALVPTQIFGDIHLASHSLTITGTGGLNVISIHSLECDGQPLILSGGPQDTFIFNIPTKVHLWGQNIELAGSLTPGQVLFNLTVTGAALDLWGPACGTFLAPNGGIGILDGTLTGAAIAYDSFNMTGGTIIGDPFVGVVPEPATLLLLGLGGVILAAKRRRR